MSEIEIAFALLLAFCAGRAWEKNAEAEREELRQKAASQARYLAATEKTANR
jgi:hypothetical protein